MKKIVPFAGLGVGGGVGVGGVANPVGRGGAEKHKIYESAFGSHLFYDLFLQGRGGGCPPLPPGFVGGLCYAWLIPISIR